MNFNKKTYFIYYKMNKIITPRLYIKPYIEQYLIDVIKIYMDPDLHQYQPVCKTESEAFNTISNMNTYFDNSYGFMGIKCIFLQDDTLVGIIPIFPYFDVNIYLELGITILTNYQQQGIAAEAILGLLNYYQNIKLIRNIYAGFYSQTNMDNISCQKLLLKCGFIFNDIIRTCCEKHLDYSYKLKF